MITALDTNILLDIFLADAKFGRASALALRKVLSEGAVLACDAVRRLGEGVLRNVLESRRSDVHRHVECGDLRVSSES